MTFPPRPDRGPAAAGAEADAESGRDDADELRRSLNALEVMRRRGLIDAESYDLRRRDLLGRSGEG